MPGRQTFVIIGAGLAGAKAAEVLRNEGFDGRVVLIGEEPVRPYERPPLSKEYLRGEKGFDFAAVHSADFYEHHEVELRTSSIVSEIDPGSSEVLFGRGERLGYDRLLLATGASPRKLEVPGADLAGVFYLRTVSDSDAIREALSRPGRVVVIGAGWVGCEVAASARQLGAEVAIVEPASLPLERVLGPEVGAVFKDLHESRGVEFHLGSGVERIVGNGAASGVRLTDGTTLDADAVVVGVGATPRTELAVGAGLTVKNGVVVDEHLQTAVPGIYAAGDVANAFHPRYGTWIRLEHWSAALNQGPAAARAMLGQEVSYDKTPFFYSDQYELGMEYRGWAPSYDRVVFRGEPASLQFLAFWLHEGRVVAAMNSNIWDAAPGIETLLLSEQEVDPQRLADPGTDLADVAGPG